MRGQFDLVPAPISAYWVIFTLLVLILLLLIFFVYMAFSMRHLYCEITEAGLKLKGGMYKKFIQKESIVNDGIDVLDLNIRKDVAPRRRLNGLAFPGYREGWFRLKSGEKAIVILTDISRVLYLPTKDGYAVMLSADKPLEMMHTMKQFWGK
jgi:hypothetical protein